MSTQFICNGRLLGGGAASIVELYISKNCTPHLTIRRICAPCVADQQSTHHNQSLARFSPPPPLIRISITVVEIRRHADRFNACAALIGISTAKTLCFFARRRRNVNFRKQKYRPDTKQPYCDRLERKLLPHVQVQKHHHTKNMQLSYGV